MLQVMCPVALQRPDQVEGSPGEACSKGGENQFVSLLDEVLVLVKAQGDAGSTGVAAILDVDQNLLLGEVQAGAHSLDDAQVGLVGHKPLDVVLGQVVALHDVLARGEHVNDSMTINGATLLINAVEVGIHRLVAGGQRRAASQYVDFEFFHWSFPIF